MSGHVGAIADAMAHELEAASDRASSGELLEPPSDAELTVLRLLATELSAREIAERLLLSPKRVSQNTIRSHKRALFHKLDVHTRFDAIARATAFGLLKQTQSPM